MVKFQLNEDGIFIVDFFGTLSLAMVSEFLDDFKKIDTLPQNLMIIYNLLDVDISLSASELGPLAQLAKESTQRYQNIRAAFVVDNPRGTALSTLFKEMKSNDTRTRQVFSSINAASNWLLGR